MIIKKQFLIMAIVLLVLTGALLSGCVDHYLPPQTRPKAPWVRDAVFAPDGKTIYFTLCGKRLSGLFVMDLEGKVKAWLLKDRFNCALFDPAVSPDGRHVAFAAWKGDDRGDLYLLDITSGGIRQLTDVSDYDRSPRFSHDGKRIFFLRHDSWGEFPSFDVPGGWDSDVFSLNVATGKVEQITRQKFHRLRNLSVFPHDRYILISTPKFIETGNLLFKLDLIDPRLMWPIVPDLYKFAKDPLHRLFDGHGFLLLKDSFLSRDGHYLVFAWQDPRHRDLSRWVGQQIFFCSMRDMQAHKITHFQNGVTPLDISPDNQWVLFRGHSDDQPMSGGVLPRTNLYMIRRDGGGMKHFSLDFSAVLSQPPANAKLP
ncbi:MAG: hypothetical protein K9K66_10055 [Desulfarculaceae bacterium]|nr:hypothetical protein [Desulfarculaceae bacterium]MCF8073750.1 hypothetical protein [Desulfarculaceae bacterium]MCF8101991.1 hypothetical protein [Desulfarculaceae bacterium]